ncbi:MAG: hypothetical protein MZW92_47025 [Comamonadaceae bacterium]|nr:hypothetical protein [Comamonadaceae bacterium]
MTVRATFDSGVPPLSATLSFTVVVAPAPVVVDLDIAALRVTGNVRVGQPISIALQACATLERRWVRGRRRSPGTPNGIGVYRRTLDVQDPVGGGPHDLQLPVLHACRRSEGNRHLDGNHRRRRNP